MKQILRTIASFVIVAVMIAAILFAGYFLFAGVHWILTDPLNLVQ